MAGTGIRNRHRVGHYLMLDDESGFTHYDDDMRQIWDGTHRRQNQFETRQPQEFVYARSDPKALRHIRPEPDVAAPNNNPSGFIGETDVPTPTSPAGHIFEASTGIGDMVIESLNTNTVFVVS